MRATLISIHQGFVPILLVIGALTLLCGVALLVARQRARLDSAAAETSGLPALLRRTFRVLLSVAAAAGVLQAILGGLLVTQGCRPGENLHYVYGAIVALAIPVAFAYSDQRQVRRDIIIMTIAAVAIVGAVVRALVTGPGGGCGA